MLCAGCELSHFSSDTSILIIEVSNVESNKRCFQSCGDIQHVSGFSAQKQMPNKVTKVQDWARVRVRVSFGHILIINPLNRKPGLLLYT